MMVLTAVLDYDPTSKIWQIKGALPQTKVEGSRPFIASITSNQGPRLHGQKARSREAAIMRIRQTIKLGSVTPRHRRKEHFTAVTSFAFMRTAKLGTVRGTRTTLTVETFCWFSFLRHSGVLGLLAGFVDICSFCRDHCQNVYILPLN